MPKQKRLRRSVADATASEWWRTDFQTTVDAFYRGDLTAGRDAAERLLGTSGLPDDIDQQVRRNSVFYAPLLDELAPSTTTTRIAIPVVDGWSCFNPSIAADKRDGRFRMNVRSSNYSMTRQLGYTVNDRGNVIRTTNYLVDLSPDLELLAVRPVDDWEFRSEPPPFPVAGFEDCRLFWYHEAWRLSATTRETHDSGTCQMVMLTLDGARVADMTPLSDGIARHEKNWMPAPSPNDGTLRFIYSCSPTVILRFDAEREATVPELIQPSHPIAKRFSGGTQAIPYRDGHLCLVHEGVNFDDGSRVYLHRWVWFDAAWQLARLSTPFLFQERGIEFAAGLARSENELIISYGLWDSETYLARLLLADVEALLRPPLTYEFVGGSQPTNAPFQERAPSSSFSLPPTSENLSAAADPLTQIATSAVASTSPLAPITPFPVDHPTIASVTLTGNSRAIIGDAVRSAVDWVDAILIVDTGVTDDTLDIARQIAGPKLIVREFPWREDFAAARNFALQAAYELGVDWAVTLDSDERLCLDGDPRAALAATTDGVLHAKHVDETYGKERFFRLPASGRFVGPTHEAFIRGDGGAASFNDAVSFDELSKTREQYQQKAQRDIAILTRHTHEHPNDPRWFYYLGDSHAGLDQHEAAITAFRACAHLRGWNEEGAWAMYRAAECLLKLDRAEEAIEACAVGMSRHAGIAELPWLASFAAWRAGRPADAVHWARISVILGHFAGTGKTVVRIGFRHPPALYEGPFDVLRFALREIGDDAGADEAERLFAAAKHEREVGNSG